eukprot:448477-Prorocentrum_lima.AAC.1
MTSSLVGSEMCIRDRFIDKLDFPTESSMSAVFMGLSHRTAAQGSSSFFSVSYTHLTLPTICSV